MRNFLKYETIKLRKKTQIIKMNDLQKKILNFEKLHFKSIKQSEDKMKRRLKKSMEFFEQRTELILRSSDQTQEIKNSHVENCRRITELEAFVNKLREKEYNMYQMVGN